MRFRFRFFSDGERACLSLLVVKICNVEIHKDGHERYGGFICGASLVGYERNYKMVIYWLAIALNV